MTGHRWSAILLGATVVLGGPCGYFTATGQLAETQQTRITITDFTDGNVSVTCRAQVDPPHGRVLWNYGNTGIQIACALGPTTDWSESISPGGQMMLECRQRR